MILLLLAAFLQDGDRSTVRPAEDFRMEFTWTAANPSELPAHLSLELIDEKTLRTLHVEFVGTIPPRSPATAAVTVRRTFLFWNATTDKVRVRLDGALFEVTGLKYSPCMGTDRDQADIAALIGKLDENEIAARDAAEQDLAKFGCKAMSQLKDAMAAPEAEKAARAGGSIGRRAVHIDLADRRDTWRGVPGAGVEMELSETGVSARSAEPHPVVVWRDGVAGDFALDAAWFGSTKALQYLAVRFEVRDAASARLIFAENIGSLGG